MPKPAEPAEPPAPPPPPEPTAASPTIADGGGFDPEGKGRSAAAAKAGQKAKRDGTQSLRIDLNVGGDKPAGKGLNIPQG
jgi:hypothetical protein